LGHTLPAYSTTTDWPRKLEGGDDITQRASGSRRLLDDCIDALITSALEQCPLHSVRKLCSAIKHPGTIVWQYLYSTGFVHNLRLVPHELSPSQKAERVEMALELQQVLQSAKHRAWSYFLTGDESWFYYTIDHCHMRIPDGEVVPTRPR
jgi:hypothetical protein